MGLDVAFDRQQAIAAGMEFETIPNDGTYSEGDDPDYIAWCKASTDCIKIPGTELYASDDGFEDHIAVRANKWGRIYEPLTDWLKANNIEWSEF